MPPAICMLKIDPEFRRLVLPLTLAEQRIMEDEICSPDKSQRIRVWHNTILVDYTCYEYCELLQLPYETVSIPCASREEVIAWICENQLERSELTTEMRRYLIGKRSATEIALGAHEYATLRQRTSRRACAVNSTSKFDSSQTRTRERLAKQYGIGASTVRKYEIYANALDQFRETVPDFIDSLLSGKFRLGLDRASAMTALNPQELRAECSRIMEETQLQTMPAWRARLRKKTSGAGLTERNTASIKDMPEFDPDAGISSLALTIPSWISTINRVYTVTDIHATTVPARLRLKDALKRLNCAADTMLKRVQEG